MADGFIRLPADSTGKSLDTQVISTGNAATTEPVHREVIVVGDRDGGDAFAVVTSSAGLMVTISSGLVALSSAPGFNIPMVSASSGLVQISGTVNVNNTSSGIIQVTAQSTNGMLPFSYVSSSSNNSNNVNSGNTAFYGYAIFNTTSAQRFVKIYATSSAPTVGTTAQHQMTLAIPGSTGGAGANLISPLDPMFYSTRGLAFTITDAAATTSTGTIGGSDLVLNLFYKTA